MCQPKSYYPSSSYLWKIPNINYNDPMYVILSHIIIHIYITLRNRKVCCGKDQGNSGKLPGDYIIWEPDRFQRWRKCVFSDLDSRSRGKCHIRKRTLLYTNSVSSSLLLSKSKMESITPIQGHWKVRLNSPPQIDSLKEYFLKS